MKIDRLQQSFIQGVSSAGLQLGLSDDRSKLVSQPFRVFDDMPRGPGPMFRLKAFERFHVLLHW